MTDKKAAEIYAAAFLFMREAEQFIEGCRAWQLGFLFLPVDEHIYAFTSICASDITYMPARNKLALAAVSPAEERTGEPAGC